MQASDPFGLDGDGGGDSRPARRAARPEAVEPLNPFLVGSGAGEPGDGPVLESLTFGRVTVTLKRGNPLIVAGAALLSLAEHLRQRPDAFASMRDIRGAAQRALHAYRANLARAGVEDAAGKAGELVLAALIDDIALNGPWPGKADWRQQPLAEPGRDGRAPGQRVFELMEEALASPHHDYPMIELIYTALALGFEGPFRTDARGPLLLIQYRERLLAAIRQEAANQASPSVSLTAGSGTHKALAYLNPFTMTLAGVLFVVVSLAVAVWVFGDTGPKFIAQAPPDLSVLRAPELLPRPDPVPARVRAAIEPDVATKLVSFDASGPSMIVGVAGDTLFQSGTAAPDKANDGVVRRLGAAVVAASGPVTIIARRNPAAPDLAAQRIAALGRMLAPWFKDRELHPMSFVVDPAGGQPPEQDIQIVLGKGVRPPPPAADAYPMPRWY